MWRNVQQRERTEEMWGHVSAVCSPEVESGLGGRQSRQTAEDASGACCPGRVGMEAGKGQQAQARKNLEVERQTVLLMRRTRPTLRISDAR